MQDKQAFIKSLAGEQRRRRPLMLPSRRALLWFVLAFVVSAVLMYSVQVFRPGFAGQLLHHPFFLVEVVGALLFSALGAYIVMVHATPGERLPRGTIVTLMVFAALFVIGLSAGFTHLAPEISPVGARHACWMEVVAYGAVCLLLFGLLVRRGFVRFAWGRGLLYGLICGLVPAALMQLACMYDPMHALIFHYLPAAALIPIGLVLMRILRR